MFYTHARRVKYANMDACQDKKNRRTFRRRTFGWSGDRKHNRKKRMEDLQCKTAIAGSNIHKTTRIIALLLSNGWYLSAWNDGTCSQGRLPDTWEKFLLEEEENGFSLKTGHSTYLCEDKQKGLCQSAQKHVWPKVEAMENNVIALKTSAGLWVSASANPLDGFSLVKHRSVFFVEDDLLIPP